MKELFSLIAKGNFKGVFFEKTDNVFIQFFRYCFVGGIATLVEGGALWLIQHFVFKDAGGFYVYFSQGIAFVLGLIANFILSKLFVFQEKSEKTNAAAALGVQHSNRLALYAGMGFLHSYCSCLELCGTKGASLQKEKIM